MIYEKPDLIFDATSCEQNCAKWLVEMGRKKDVTVNLEYLIMFDEYAPFEIAVVNEDRVVTDADDLFLTATKYI